MGDLNLRRFLLKNYRVLLKHFGPQKWWPAKSRWEVIAGAVLTQNTSWSNVEKAVNNLKKSNCLGIRKIASLENSDLQSIIRPAGFYKQKTAYLKNIAFHIREHYNWNLGKFLAKDTFVLRRELLGIRGVGQETADSILLYAAGKPVFVVDAYTNRILKRWGLKNTGSYGQNQLVFEKNLPRKAGLFNEYHALLVILAKTYCKKSPWCAECPLTKNGCAKQ